MASEASMRGRVSEVKRSSEEVSRNFPSSSGRSLMTVIVSGFWKYLTRKNTPTAELSISKAISTVTNGSFCLGLDCGEPSCGWSFKDVADWSESGVVGVSVLEVVCGLVLSSCIDDFT